MSVVKKIIKKVSGVLLTFSFHNHKLNLLAKYLGLKLNQVVGFDNPAGHTCPAADICLSFAERETGKITDGDNCKVRCFAASGEAVFPTVRKARWRNFEMLRKLTQAKMVELILASIPKGVKVIRIHSAGDYFSRRYFLAWVEVAKQRPDVTFFGYTKVLPYVSYPKPDNYRLVYSWGGKMDSKRTNEPTAYIVESLEQAEKLGVKVACQNNPADDFDYIMRGESFALMIHGTQPKRKKGKKTLADFYKKSVFDKGYLTDKGIELMH